MSHFSDDHEAGQTPRRSVVIKEVPCTIPDKRSFDIRGIVFTVHKKYELIKAVGVGAYGVVMAAYDTEKDQKVALKKISGVFDDLTDAKRILREIRLMQTFDHENILPLYDIEDPESLDSFEDVYMVSPLYDRDLSKIIESEVELFDEHHKYFVYQILCALKFLHSTSVMHRDLKPANILVQETCDVALCDFGLARYVEESDAVADGMTEYVVTRWYRAPELVLTHEYTNAVDLWAVGCIMGDLLGRRALFPGKDFKNQVETICQILGKPSEDDYAHVTSGRARKFLEKLPNSPGVKFSELYPEANPHALDLMGKLLKFNPAQRLTAEEALEHPYISEFHEAEFEQTAKETIDMSEIEPRSADGGALTASEVKNMIAKEIYKFRPNAPLFEKHPELVPH